MYDADSELTDTTDQDGRRTTYSYNADGDQTGETWIGASPSEKITYTYDADNEMTGAVDSFATLTFTYDGDGQVQNAVSSGPGVGQPNVALSYTYDPSGSEISLTDNLSSAGITTYSYDADEQVTSVASSYGGTAGPQVAYNYDSGGRITSASRTIDGTGTTVNTSFSYDAANRETGINDQVTTYSSGGGSGGTTTSLASYVYTYDKTNRVTSETDAEGLASFAYDSANELTTVTGSRSESYTYDLNGNRTGTGYSTTVMNETATSPGTTYTYDKVGNMISAKTGSTITTYTYDYRNRLTEVTQGGTVIATYTYDAANRRIGVDDNGSQTWTVYDGINPYADFNGSGTLQQRYLYGPGVVDGAVVDQLLARTSSTGTTAWYLPDKLGSVRDIVSASSGAELDHIVYDSFGNILTETNAANGDRFKYAGMEYDSAIGQYYDRARGYSPVLGLFTSQDPLGFAAGYMDLYSYVGGDATNAVDPTGMYGSPEDPPAPEQKKVGSPVLTHSPSTGEPKPGPGKQLTAPAPPATGGPTFKTEQEMKNYIWRVARKPGNEPKFLELKIALESKYLEVEAKIRLRDGYTALLKQLRTAAYEKGQMKEAAEIAKMQLQALDERVDLQLERRKMIESAYLKAQRW